MSRIPIRRSVLEMAVVASLIAAPALVDPINAAAVPSSTLVINEVYGGGGNSGATYTNDFVEVLNRGATSVDLAGWSVQYTSAGGTGSWQVTTLSGTVAPGEYFVVAEGKGTGGTTPVPAQLTGTIAMGATGGSVALVAGANALTCNDSASCRAAAVDLVGYGSAAINEGAPAQGADNTHSVGRVPTADTDSNAQDFLQQDPTPGAATPVVTPPPPEPGTTRIHDIQGTSFVSPRNGQTVSNVPGIVTAVRATGSSRGYFVQDPNPDADPDTSEGVFVFTGAPTVSVGDSVLFSGKVQDYYAGGPPATAQTLSVTEINNSTVYVLDHGNSLPAPEIITSTTVPELYAPDLAGGNIEDTPIDPTRSALDFWESREGMRVQIDDARVVGPTDAYGEQYVTTKPTQKTSYRGGTLLTAENATPSGRVEIVPVVRNLAVSVGDVYAGATVGPVDYSQFGGYLIAATQLGSVSTAAEVTPVVATTPTARELSVATYNVENLAPSDAQSKFDALAKGIVTNLQAPDIVAVEEVQDNSGATDDGVVAADQTLKKLTDAIVAAGGPQYSSREIDPSNDQDGGQPGGNIRNVFLFNPSRVAFVDVGSSTVDRTSTGTVVTGSFGRPALTLSPGRIDPGNAAWNSSRKPLVGEFRFRGLPVYVIANHFNSKGGDGNADGRFQYPTRSSEVQRAQQAALVHGFVQEILRRNPLAQTVVLGDLNDYQFSPALKVLKTGSATGSGRPLLVDLIATLPTDQQYTYVYQGISQVLDHILVTPGTYLTGTVNYQVVHINSEFANQTSDHDPQVVRLFGSYRR